MVRRAAIFALLVQQFVWLNLVVPGHTRGRYTLAPDSADCAASASCCASSDHHKSDPATPTPTERARCAVCTYALGTCAPPPMLCAPTPLGLLSLIDAPAPSAAPVVHLPPAYYGRAPPVV